MSFEESNERLILDPVRVYFDKNQSFSQMRKDRRSNDQLRDITLELGIVEQSDGSALFGFGSTKAIAAIYGPKEAGILEREDGIGVKVSIRPRSSLKGPKEHAEEKLVVNMIRQYLVPYLMPATDLRIFIQILGDHGSRFSCCFNAVVFALLNACVPLSGQLCAVNYAVLDGNLLADPNEFEEEIADSLHLVINDQFSRVDSNELYCLESFGTFSMAEVQEAKEASKQACNVIWELMKVRLTQK